MDAIGNLSVEAAVGMLLHGVSESEVAGGIR